MSTGALKVLVIDDEPPIRKLLRMGLVTQGYEILEAPNGTAALELLPQSPDLIILGGGASRKIDKWLPYLDVPTEIVPAAMSNDAGIIGAALSSDNRRLSLEL